jgi:hypothetical protein
MIHPVKDWLTKDDDGMLMPWYTRPCLEVLDKMDFVGKNVFEYGCGHSTLWYRKRGATVFGVDSNPDWAKFAGVDYVDPELGPESYLKSIERCVKYDFIIIDGLFRDQCTEYAIDNLAHSGGLIIIDNYNQPSVEPNDWTETNALIELMGLHLYKEPNHPDWSTLVIYSTT